MDLQQEAQAWLESTAGVVLDAPFAEALRDGVVLCKAANALMPHAVDVYEGESRFKQMANASQFLAFARAAGVEEADLFPAISLADCKDTDRIASAILALKSAVGDETTAPRTRSPARPAPQQHTRKQEEVGEQHHEGPAPMPRPPKSPFAAAAAAAAAKAAKPGALRKTPAPAPAKAVDGPKPAAGAASGGRPGSNALANTVAMLAMQRKERVANKAPQKKAAHNSGGRPNSIGSTLSALSNGLRPVARQSAREDTASQGSLSPAVSLAASPVVALTEEPAKTPTLRRSLSAPSQVSEEPGSPTPRVSARASASAKPLIAEGKAEQAPATRTVSAWSQKSLRQSTRRAETTPAARPATGKPAEFATKVLRKTNAEAPMQTAGGTPPPAFATTTLRKSPKRTASGSGPASGSALRVRSLRAAPLRTAATLGRTQRPPSARLEGKAMSRTLGRAPKAAATPVLVDRGPNTQFGINRRMPWDEDLPAMGRKRLSWRKSASPKPPAAGPTPSVSKPKRLSLRKSLAKGGEGASQGLRTLARRLSGERRPGSGSRGQGQGRKSLVQRKAAELEKGKQTERFVRRDSGHAEQSRPQTADEREMANWARFRSY